MANAAVTEMERAKNPRKTWNAAKNEWVVEGKKVSFIDEQRTRAAAARAAKAQSVVDEERPKRGELSRDAGPWPGASGPVWMGRKGKLWMKRTGPFGELPFGVGHHYALMGTWSAEPMDPVETFWTMPP